MNIRPVRGTHDMYGKDINKFNLILKIVSKYAMLSSFYELKTPIFESSELFIKPLGEHSDVVLKEMYTFKDRNEDLLTLRPEYTTPMIRAAISNNLLNNLPLKLYGIGPMFRRERPQKGRQRQFHQFGVEAIGSNNPEQDAEVIILAWEILSKSGINNLELKLSSIGSDDCRNKYKNALIKFLEPHKNKLTNVSKERLKHNPLRILDTKNKEEINILKAAPIIGDFYTNEDREHFENLQKYLSAVNIPFTLDPLLVRGLDYYTQTTFEIISKDIGAQDALLGGGRYNGLIKSLGGKDTPAVGLSNINTLGLIINARPRATCCL